MPVGEGKNTWTCSSLDSACVKERVLLCNITMLNSFKQRVCVIRNILEDNLKRNLEQFEVKRCAWTVDIRRRVTLSWHVSRPVGSACSRCVFGSLTVPTAGFAAKQEYPLFRHSMPNGEAE